MTNVNIAWQPSQIWRCTRSVLITSIINGNHWNNNSIGSREAGKGFVFCVVCCSRNWFIFGDLWKPTRREKINHFEMIPCVRCSSGKILQGMGIGHRSWDILILHNFHIKLKQWVIWLSQLSFTYQILGFKKILLYFKLQWGNGKVWYWKIRF